MKLATIGYEGAAQPSVIEALKAAGVEVVIDVRAVAASRRPGFSKTILAASLDAAGIAYLHLRGLGTPKSGRLAARAGHTEEMHAIYEAHLAEPAVQGELAEAVEVARGRTVALLCYEADYRACHRLIVADRMAELAPFEVEHLSAIG